MGVPPNVTATAPKLPVLPGLPEQDATGINSTVARFEVGQRDQSEGEVANKTHDIS